MKSYIIIILLLVVSSYQAVAQTIVWQPTNGPYGGGVRDIVQTPDNDLFVGMTFSGVYRSTNNGESWHLDGLINSGGIAAIVLDTLHRQVVVLTNQGVFRRSFGDSQPWIQDLNAPNVSLIALSPKEGILYGRASVNRLYCCPHPDSPWVEVFSGAYLGNPVVDPRTGILYVTESLNNTISILRSTDRGKTWGITIDSLTSSSSGTELVVGGRSELYAVTTKLRRSDDSGVSWKEITIGLPDSMYHTLSVAPDGSLLAVNNRKQMYRSTNQGDIWTQVVYDTTIIPRGRIWFGANETMFSTASDESITDEISIIRSTDYGKRWVSSTRQITGIAFGAITVDAEGNILASAGQNLYQSTDAGASWSRSRVVIQGTGSINISGIVPVGKQQLLVGTSLLGVLFRANENNNWELRNTGFRTSFERGVYRMLSLADGTIFVGTGSGLFRSRDTARSWQKIGFSGFSVQMFASNNIRIIYAGTSDISGKSFWRSIDSGYTWEIMHKNIQVQGISIGSDSIVFIASNNGLFRSMDQGETLERCIISSGDTNFIAVAVNPRGPVLAATPSTVYHSTDQGKTWEPQSTGIGGKIQDITFDKEGRAMITTWGGGLFLSSKTTSTVPLPNRASTSITVTPNPCLTGTTVSFELSHPSIISLRIFNSRGECISTIRNDTPYPVGHHSLFWDATSISEGVYFYEFQSDGKTENGKIIVRKKT